MSSSTSSRSTLTITPSTMSPSLKYLMVWSIAARKSSSVPMSLTAIWGVLEGRTWVEVMWSSAPDGECVGTGTHAAGDRGGRAGGAGGGGGGGGGGEGGGGARAPADPQNQPPTPPPLAFPPG